MSRDPPTLKRRGRGSTTAFYWCDECGNSNVPGLVTFNVVAAGPEENYDGTHSVCKACLENALAMFNDPNLVKTATPLSPSEIAARAFATRAHGYQKYDSGTEPYVLHLAEVRDVVVEFGYGTTELLASAWLHDVIEDTTHVVEEIKAQFGETVANLVWAVTGRGVNRKARNEDAYTKMVENPGSIPLKLADRIANARASKQTSPDALFEMYKREHPIFKGRLERASGTDPRTVAMWRTLDQIFDQKET
jgi:guanosine-3',5'-bis(diphosphate) 3'-pyrophosphohydrolase